VAESEAPGGRTDNRECVRVASVVNNGAGSKVELAVAEGATVTCKMEVVSALVAEAGSSEVENIEPETLIALVWTGMLKPLGLYNGGPGGV
jgi:hypothetical protein